MCFFCLLSELEVEGHKECDIIVVSKQHEVGEQELNSYTDAPTLLCEILLLLLSLLLLYQWIPDDKP